jgi:alanine racemase
MKWAEVSLPTLRANAAAFKRATGTPLMAMVKAQAYGHGGTPAARALLEGGATWLGVALAAEALQLRGEGIEAPILVVGWSHPDSHQAMIEAGVDITVSDANGLNPVIAAARRAGRRAGVQLKLETGMHRQGIALRDLPGVLQQAAANADHVDITGVFTHMADADGPETAHTEMQHRRFQPAAAEVKRQAPHALVHCANSAAALRFPSMRHDVVRPGIALYGYAPPHCPPVAVKPAMRMQALVTHVQTVAAGESVGYNCTWTAERDTRVATVAAGYADGVQRAQSNRGSVVVAGERCPILGRVSMDQISVDVSALDAVQPGDVATLFGPELPADEVAAAGGTSSYEVLCAVSARVPRRFEET